jgi:hypothetical protein
MPPKTNTNANKTANTKQSANTKQPAKKTQSKPEPKKQQSKVAVEKKVQRKNLNQCVGFVYGGSLIKGSHVYLFQCDNVDAVSHVRETLVPYFGGNVNGRYVKCEDAEETMNSILATAEEKGFNTDPDCQNILKCNIGDGSELIKTAANVNIAHLLKLNEAEDKPKKTTTKGSKAPAKGVKTKKVVDDDDDDDEGDEDDEEGDEVSDEEDDDDEDDEEEDEVEEVEVKPTKKASQTPQKGNAKTGNGAKAKVAPKTNTKKGGK